MLKTLLMAATLAVTTNAASAMTLKCKITQSDAGVVPKEMLLVQKPGASTATVLDPIVITFNDRKPMEAKVVTDNGKRLRVTWEVTITNRSGQRARMAYSATWLKAAKRMSVQVTPLGYANSFTGFGTCAVS